MRRTASSISMLPGPISKATPSPLSQRERGWGLQEVVEINVGILIDFKRHALRIARDGGEEVALGCGNWHALLCSQCTNLADDRRILDAFTNEQLADDAAFGAQTFAHGVAAVEAFHVLGK
jgi:hypothetical protein